MNPAKLLMMMGGGVRFIGYGAVVQDEPGTTNIPYPAGTQPGDLAFVCARSFGSGYVISSGVWPSTGLPAMSGGISHKVLTGADISATITTNTASPILVLVFRGFSGATAIAVQGEHNEGDGADSKTWSGFNKGSSCRALVLFTFVSSAPGATLSFDSPSLPSATLAPSPGPVGGILARAKIDLVPAEYANGASVTISGYTTGWTQRSFVAFKLI